MEHRFLVRRAEALLTVGQTVNLMSDSDSYDGSIQTNVTAQSAYRNIRQASRICLEHSPLGLRSPQKASSIQNSVAGRSPSVWSPKA
ncbi:hypothetical protein J3P89_15120 [Pseudomonas sp. Z1-14]|uniref:hypothetical protein n=1 Tax=Pseudomonas TaxID=286 RepID=UPI00216086A8|nr:hypothetical protein [Pseudomonas brassicacearum]UVM46797.1 hypothetical protein LOY47_11185 [Pseudomonas brassicacearum]